MLAQPHDRKDFYIRLKGCMKTSKTVVYNPDETWDVFHDISGDWEEGLTELELKENTNIPEAIEKGAMYLYDFEKEYDDEQS